MLKPSVDNGCLHIPSTRNQASTLVTLARRQYEQQPENLALIFITSSTEPAHQITYRAFFDKAQGYADVLQTRNIQRGDVVILVMEHSETLLYAFWGALMIGAIPSIFPFLSEKLDASLYFARVRALIIHSGAKAVIASPAFAGPLAKLIVDTSIPVVDGSQLNGQQRGAIFTDDLVGEDIALLQHSSGTTGLQKGVALSHTAILNQLANYGSAIQLNRNDCIVSWLPLYHDMGLIAGFIQPIAQGIPLVLMSPFEWVRDPKMLLWAIHTYHGTLTWLPNFAYNFMAKRIQARAIEGLDLSTMRLFINCSEPARPESHTLFVQKFGSVGVKVEMLGTCYAMAENTFAVTQGAMGLPARVDTINRVIFGSEQRAVPAQAGEPSFDILSCGNSISNCHLKIVDASRQLLTERHVGEVMIQSDSLLSSYHHRDDLTNQSLVDGWFLTGDLGYLADGELFIVGRKKDLIIVGGKNIYPQDLESMVTDIPGIHPGRVVAFGVPDDRLGTEAIVIAAEADSPDETVRAQIARDIYARVVQQTDTAVNDVLIVDRNWLIKTSSGKIARADNRQKYLERQA